MIMNKSKILELLEEIKKELEDKKIELEPKNFRVNSNGWTKITVDGKEYLENPEKDIWELLDEEYRGEQLFTWDSAMRETKKAGERIPTDEEFKKLEKKDFGKINYTGNRYINGFFLNRGTYTFLWSSTSELGANAWRRDLHSSNSTVYRSTGDKENGFSVRCVKD